MQILLYSQINQNKYLVMFISICEVLHYLYSSIIICLRTIFIGNSNEQKKLNIFIIFQLSKIAIFYDFVNKNMK